MWRRVLSTALKLAVAVALVWWLVSSGIIDVGQLTASLSTARGAALGAVAALLGIAAEVLMAWRFSYMLEHRGVDVPRAEVIGLTLAANMVGLVLPGIAGADAMRVTYLAGRTHERRVDAITAVFVDRVVGLVGLVVLAAVTSPVIALSGIAHVPVQMLWVGPVLAVVAGLASLLLASPAFGRSGPFRRLLDRLPAWLTRSGSVVRAYARSPRTLVWAVLLAVASHAALVGSFICAGLILRDPVPVAAHFALDPLAMVLNAVPVTPGGLGLTEGAFSLLYRGAGSSSGGDVGMLGRVLYYAGFTLAGLPALLTMRSPMRRAAEALPTDEQDQG